MAVCGIGNVALDCARVLLRSPSELAPTDLARHALRQLQSGSRVREVHLVARRGPVQVGGPPACALQPLQPRWLRFWPRPAAPGRALQHRAA